MRFTAFEFRNFKGIGSVTLDLRRGASPAHALVGLNESGKTTVLEAISAFGHGLDDSELGALEMPGWRFEPDPNLWIPIADRLNFNGEITIGATLRIEEVDRSAVADALLRDHGVELKSLSDGCTVKEHYKFADSKHTKKHSKWTLEVEGRKKGKGHKTAPLTGAEWQTVVRVLRERFPVIWHFPNFLFDIPEWLWLENLPAATPLENRKHEFYRETIADVLRKIDPKMTLAQHVVARLASADEADKRSLESLDLNVSKELTKTIFGTWNEILGQNIQGKEIAFESKLVEGKPAARIRIRDKDGYFLLAERSLGFRWFFIYIFLTAYRGVRNADGRSILILLDEPASNLHSTAQSLLLESFERLADRCPVIYTTHSHHLINLRWLEATVVVYNAGLEGVNEIVDGIASRTDIRVEPYRSFVNSHPNQTSYYQAVLDHLRYKPSPLELTKLAVLFEGKADASLLELGRRSLGLDQFAIVPGTGAGTLETPITLVMAMGGRPVVVLDADVEGDNQKWRYLEKFGAFLDGRVFTISELVAGFSGEVESMLEPADSTGLLSACTKLTKSMPTKKDVRVAVEEVLARDGVFHFDPESVRRFHEFFDRVSALQAS